MFTRIRRRRTKQELSQQTLQQMKKKYFILRCQPYGYQRNLAAKHNLSRAEMSDVIAGRKRSSSIEPVLDAEVERLLGPMGGGITHGS